jgi:hypothetical protein
MQVRSGGQSVAVPFFVGTDETVFSLRYVDFLTLVTGDWFARSVAGETVTVFTIRLID